MKDERKAYGHSIKEHVYNRICLKYKQKLISVTFNRRAQIGQSFYFVLPKEFYRFLKKIGLYFLPQFYGISMIKSLKARFLLFLKLKPNKNCISEEIFGLDRITCKREASVC